MQFKKSLVWLFCLLIYISIPCGDKQSVDDANQWVSDNADHGAQNTFIPNMTGSDGSTYCLVSIADKGTYAEKMKEQFGFTTVDPRVKSIEAPQLSIDLGGGGDQGNPEQITMKDKVDA